MVSAAKDERGREQLAGVPVSAVPALAGAVVALVGLSLTFALTAGTASADNGPHGGYGIAPDACAACHRAHTAGASDLLLKTASSLCLGCHDGLGADTDVANGVYRGLTNRGLKAGGFTYALMDTDWDQASTSLPVSSAHIVDGSTGTAWGHGPIGSGPGTVGFDLSCTSCHDPHGRAGTGDTATYRLLRPIPLGSEALAGVDIPDEEPKEYAVSDSDNQYFGQLYGDQRDPLSQWCGACHTRYEAPTGSATVHSGDSIFAYRHMTEGSADCTICHDIHGGGFMLPNPYEVPSAVIHAPRCVTCHVAHGTSASMGPYSGTVAWPDGATTPDGDGRSSLLRLDSRAVCQHCHPR